VVWAADLSLFIAIHIDKIYTSADGITWDLRDDTKTGMVKIIVGTKDGNTRIVIAANSGGCYSDDGLTWTSANCKVAAINFGAFQTGSERFWVCGNSGAMAYSDNGGQNWSVLSPSIVFSNARDIWRIVCNGSGAVIALGTEEISFSGDDGVTWSNIGQVDSATGYVDWLVLHNQIDTLLLLSRENPTTVYRYMRPWKASLVAGGNTTVGEINYTTGIGAITAGDVPTTATARHFLYPREVSEYILTTRGASPIRDASLTIFAQSLNYDTLVVFEDPDNAGVLIGNGSGTVDNDTGVAIVEFDTAVLPETITLSYTYGSVYHPTYDEINTRGLPIDGLVPLVQEGDVLVLTDGVNQEMLTAIAVSGNLIRVAQSLINNYDVGSYACCALVLGDMQSVQGVEFTQAAWNGTTWTDEQEGSAAPDSYDWNNYPLEIINNGAITERWALDIVSKSGSPPYLRVDVIGENVGTVLTNQPITSDIAPLNPNTGTPYFTVDADGWPVSGGNFEFGNVVRFNTEGAIAPLWVCRVVNAGNTDVTEDSATLEVRGDVGVTTTTTETTSTT